MAVNWKQVEKTVKKTIADLGEKSTVVLQSPATSDFSTTQPFEGPADNGTSYTVQAVVTPYELSERDTGMDQTRGDFTVYITGSALTIIPAIGWLCLLQGVKYRITNVEIIRPGTTVLLWTLVVAR